MLDQLTLLVDKSLVVSEDSRHGTRYRLLETVRQYAQEKLGESGEAVAVRVRHRDHYTAMAALLDSPAPEEHEQRVEQAQTEIDNLRAAFAWSMESADIEQALRLASALQPLWLTRGRIQEGLAWVEVALARHGGIDPEVSAAVRAQALANKAVLDSWVGAASTTEADEALAVARELDDPALLARVLYACGCAAVFNNEAAQRYFAEALDLARALGDRWRLSQILSRQSHAAFVTGDPITVRAIAEEGRDLADAIGDRFESRQCRFRLAGAQCFEGDLAGAISPCRELLAEAEADHDVMLRVIVLLTLGHAEAYHGDTDAARATAETAIEAAAELGEYYVGAANTALVVAALAAGDVVLAVDAADAAFQGIGAETGTMALNSAYFAQAVLAHGDIETARRWADDAVAATTGWYRAVALTTRARVAVAQGEPELAERDARDALACAAGVKAYTGAPDTLEVLAGLVGRARGHHEAARLFGAADAMRRPGGEVRFKIYDSDYERSIAAVRDAMGDSDFDAAWAEGAALSTDEAVAYAQRGRGERKRPASGWASLTPTELDVVRLVSEGLSNSGIATRLFGSPRTVQSHLTHVYNKLGLASRVQLAREATRYS
ncbi:MAG TPA: LuxR C-terminal-related transcriptional regulator [Mycobacterium sp.]